MKLWHLLFLVAVIAIIEIVIPNDARKAINEWGRTFTCVEVGR